MEKKQYSLFDLLDRELVKKAQDNMNQNGAGKKILYDVNDFDIVDLDKRNYVAIWVEGRIVGYIVETEKQVIVLYQKQFWRIQQKSWSVSVKTISK